MIWQNGKKPATRTQALEQIIDQLKIDLTEWNHQHIEVVMNILSDLEVIITPHRRLQDIIDLSALPSEPIPDRMKTYPIWAMDKSGRCLSGAGQLSITPLSEIREWFVSRKPGYCTRPKEKACYQCNLTKNNRDCRNNLVFFPAEPDNF